MQLTCCCLNVCVHTRGTTIDPTDISTLNLTNEEESHKFFQNRIALVALDLGGITKAQPILTTDYQAGDWTVCTCIGCGMNTHAIDAKQQGQKVLVNLDMKNETTSITKLMETENYSSTFKIILPEVNDNCTEINCDAEFQIKNSKLDNAVLSIKKQVASYLQQEQKAMEERIRLFTQQQQTDFTTLQKKVRRDKLAMMNLLRKLQETELKESLGDAMTENNVFIPSAPLFRTDSGNDTFGNNKLDNRLPQMQIEVQTRPTSYLRSQSFDFRSMKKNRSSRSQHSQKKAPPSNNKECDSSGIFDMEGLEHDDDDSAPSFSSDYEGDTDDSTIDEPSRRHCNPKQYAHSLPISVPNYHLPPKTPSGYEEEEKVSTFVDPAQIAASIRASVTATDGTEMFGDLPRRRLNTGDLVKSRPI